MKLLVVALPLWVACTLLPHAGFVATDIDIPAPRSDAAGSSIGYSSDSDDFSVKRASAQYFGSYTDADHKIGVRYGENFYARQSWSRRGQHLGLVRHHIDAKTRNGWLVEAGLNQQGSHTLAVADASYRQALSGATAFELFANRDYVETVAGLEAGTHYTFIGASGDVVLSERVTLVGLVGEQIFSDDNRRSHVRGRLIVQPMLDLGLTLQVRARYFENSKSAGQTAGVYFNPRNYDELMLAMGWRQRIAGWQTKLTVGTGRQHIATGPAVPSKLLEAEAERKLQNYVVRLRGGFVRSASFAGPDYRYRHLTVEVILPF